MKVDSAHIKERITALFKTWWCSLLLVPFAIYSLHQAYWTLRFNIFFAISYEAPFPVGFIHFLLSNFLLIIHEAGHTLLGIFGFRTLTILGGSLFEILLPLLILAYHWYNQLRTGIQLSLYLVGYAFVNVSFYVADAGARQLPLIGGLSKEAHDWHNLLGMWGITHHDLTLGVLLVALGGICYLAAILTPAFFVRYQRKNIEMEL